MISYLLSNGKNGNITDPWALRTFYAMVQRHSFSSKTLVPLASLPAGKSLKAVSEHRNDLKAFKLKKEAGRSLWNVSAK